MESPRRKSEKPPNLGSVRRTCEPVDRRAAYFRCVWNALKCWLNAFISEMTFAETQASISSRSTKLLFPADPQQSCCIQVQAGKLDDVLSNIIIILTAPFCNPPPPTRLQVLKHHILLCIWAGWIGFCFVCVLSPCHQHWFNVEIERPASGAWKLGLFFAILKVLLFFFLYNYMILKAPICTWIFI